MPLLSRASVPAAALLVTLTAASAASADVFSVSASGGQAKSATFSDPPGSESGPGTFLRGLQDFDGDTFAGEYVSGFWDAEYSKPVILFELPALPDGDALTGANLDVRLFYRNGTPAYNVDVEFLGLRDASEVEIEDFTAPGTRVADDFLTPGAAAETVFSTDDAEDAVVTTLLSASYDAGRFAAFRLSYDASPVAYEAYILNGAGTDLGPVLTLTSTAVPEPASLALLGLGAGLTLIRRR